MLIIRSLNCIDVASDTVTLIKWPSGAPDGHTGDYVVVLSFNCSGDYVVVLSVNCSGD